MVNVGQDLVVGVRMDGGHQPSFNTDGIVQRCNQSARQLVVQEALEITVSEAFSESWLTPYTMVASTSEPPGAEIITFLAPPSKSRRSL